MKKSIKSKIIAHLDGELEESGVQELSGWITKSGENARFYAEVKDLWEASIADSSEFADTKNEWKRFVKRISRYKGNSKSKTIIPHWTRYVAAALILIALVINGVLIINTSTSQEAVFVSALAPKGSVSQLLLPDSTIVYLNAGSEIRCAIDIKHSKREVFLTGEAYFQVTHHAEEPFIVHTPFYNVNVLGTEFNVKSYPGDIYIETTLEEGSVLVTSSENFKLSEDIVLKPGEQLSYDKENKTMQLKKVDTELFTSWKDNKLIFLNMNFGDLIVLMERKYGVDIEVDDKDILKYHYSGTIKNETVLEMFEIIKHTMPIHYKIEGQKIKIYKNH